METMRTTLEGATAPDFTLPNQDEQWVDLKDFREKGAVMLVFYPGDFTVVCTKQLCAYQDNFSQFKKYGIQLVGISPNLPINHREFVAKYKFEFPLLSDPNKAVTKAYGVTSLFMLGGNSRAVFILASTGEILYRYVEPTRATYRKPLELLLKLEALKRDGKI